MTIRRLIASILLLLLLAALPCGGAFASDEADTGSFLRFADELTDDDNASDDPARTEIFVSDVDGLLDAIGPDRTIWLAPGEYDLTAAESYGSYELLNDYAWWVEVFDGFELLIADADGLTIAALDGPGSVTICTSPRYADILSFQRCRELTLSGLTLGHSDGRGECIGGVLDLTDTDVVTIDGCDLYGCGVLGVRAENSRSLNIFSTTIRECSDGAVELERCYDVRLVECSLIECGDIWSYPCYAVLRADSCCGVALLDSEVRGNHASCLISASGSRELYLYDTLFDGNTCPADWGGLTLLSAWECEPVTVAGCAFTDEDFVPWVGEPCAVDLDDQLLTEADIAAMEREFVMYDGVQTVPLDVTYEDGLRLVSVTDTDELLAALGPDTIIYLAPGEYDLSEAMNYGSYGGSYYAWQEEFDGYALVVSGAENLHLVGEARDTTLICTEPRYADVLAFRHGGNISVADITLGHTLEPGSCAGGVLRFQDIAGVTVAGCGLFGCGTVGFSAYDCTDITVLGCEIYQCSLEAVELFGCRWASFMENDIHDCAWPTYDIYLCKDVTIDGEAVAEAPLEDEYGTDWGSPIIADIFASGAGVDFTTIDLPDAGPYASYYETDPDAVG